MSSSSMSNTRKIKLRTSDGEIFEVEEAMAMQSETLKSMMEVISVPEVHSKTLSIFCNKCLDHHIGEQQRGDDCLRDWVLHLFQVDQAAFFDLILAARYLKIKTFEDSTSQTMADIIRGKTLEEIKQTSNINTHYKGEIVRNI